MNQKIKTAKQADFDFWRENLKENHFQLNQSQLKEKFAAWLKTCQTNWLNNTNSERIIREFITCDSGLNSVHESDQFNFIFFTLKDLILAEEKTRNQ